MRALSKASPLSIVLAAGLAGVLSPTAAAQTEYVWQGFGSGMTSSTSWNFATSWINQDTLTVNGFPTLLDVNTPGDIATFNSDATAIGPGGAGLITTAPSTTLTISAVITLNGVLENDGTVTFVADNADNGAQGVLDQAFFVLADGEATLSSGGTMVMAGRATGIQGEDRGTSTLTNGPSHTIAGGGVISDIIFNNTGTILATSDFTVRRADMDGSNGTMTQNAGELTFDNSTAVNIIGLLADDADLSIEGGASLTQSRFAAGLNSEIRIVSGSLSRPGQEVLGTSDGFFTAGNESQLSTLEGNWFNTGTMGFAGSLTLNGIIDNTGVISFAADNSNNGNQAIIDQRFAVGTGGDLRLQGGGTVTFNGLQNGIQGVNSTASTLTNAIGHTIIGSGTIDRLGVTNRGTINATNSFALTSSTVDNTNGLIRASGGRMTISGSTITGGGQAEVGPVGIMSFVSTTAGFGSITSEGEIELAGSGLTGSLTTLGGIFEGTTESGQSFSGDWLNTGSVQLRGGVSYAGTITNNGDLSFLSDNSNNSTPTLLDQTLRVGDGVVMTITGPGAMHLTGSATGLEGVGPGSTLNNNGGHTITGVGVIEDLTIANTGGTIEADGTLTLRRLSVSDGIVRVEPGATASLNGVTADGVTLQSEGSVVFTGASAAFTSATVETSGGVFLGLSEALGSSIQGNWTNSGPLQIQNAITFDGVLTNPGTVTFASDNSNTASPSVLDQRLAIGTGGSITLQGSGAVEMTGSATGIQGNGAAVSTLTNTGDHTISGTGSIRDLMLINEAFVLSGGNTTILNTVIDNEGGLFAATGGTLTITNSTLTGGNVIASSVAAVSFSNTVVAVDEIDMNPGSTLFFGGSDITAEIETSSGELNAVAESGQAITGLWTNTGDLTLRNAFDFVGTLMNTGTITFAPDASNNSNPSLLDQAIRIPAGEESSILENGTIVLNGSATGIQGGGPTSILNHGNQHTITGNGQIRDLTINNDGGTITNTGPLSLTNLAIANGVGIVAAGQGFTMSNVQWTQPSLTVNGTLGFQPGVASSLTDGVFVTNDAVLDGSGETPAIVLQGLWSNNGSTRLVDAFSFEGDMLNNGEITFNPDNSNNFNPNLLDQRFVVPAGSAARLIGPGRFRLTGSAVGIQGSDAASSVLVNLPDHTILGRGEIRDLVLNNAGTIAPAQGDLVIRNTTVNSLPGNRYQFTFANGSPGRLRTISPFNAEGIIDIGFLDGVVPDPNAIFEVVTSPGRVGTFVNAPADGDGISFVSTPNGTFTVFYGPQTISITSVVPAGGTLPDLNNDGRENFFDVLAFLGDFDAAEPSADIDGLPGFTAGDVEAFLQIVDD